MTHCDIVLYDWLTLTWLSCVELWSEGDGGRHVSRVLQRAEDLRQLHGRALHVVPQPGDVCRQVGRGKLSNLFPPIPGSTGTLPKQRGF